MPRRIVMRPCWPLERAFLESIVQHDPKAVEMGLVMRPTWAQNGFKNRHCAGGEHFLEKMTAT